MSIFEMEKNYIEIVEETVKDSMDKVAETANEIRGKNESIFPDFFKDLPTDNTYTDLNTMKIELRKTYKEIKKDKPLNSPNLVKWLENGGKIKIDEIDKKQVWTYIDKINREVPYVNGGPIFPLEAKHKTIKDINIKTFTGDRNEDKKIYLKELEEQYSLTEIPDGYVLHHDAHNNGNMQLIKADWHKEFTHMGGHSRFKEVE